MLHHQLPKKTAQVQVRAHVQAQALPLFLLKIVFIQFVEALLGKVLKAILLASG